MARWITGDVCDALAQLDDNSVDLIVTSPPFLALRSYLPADHPDKDKEIGSEATPAEYIDTLLAVTTDLRRVLAPHGSLCVELGDTYSGSGGGGGDYYDEGLRAGQPGFTGSAQASRDALREANAAHWRQKNQNKDAWPLTKSKALIPQSYEWALAYGRNPFTGAVSPAGQWRVRNIVTWCRPNPPVGSLGDKWRTATSDVIVACTSDKRYWDDLATRQPFKYPDAADRPRIGHKEAGKEGGNTANNPAGAPLLDYWEIPPGGFDGAHYAVFPPALVEPLVRAMCPEKVCQKCGEPSRRISSSTQLDTGRTTNGPKNKGRKAESPTDFETRTVSQHQTLGWTDCGHNDYRPGTVLDPFAGSGTTLAVAEALERNAIGIDIDERNQTLFESRVYDPYVMGLRQMGLFEV